MRAVVAQIGARRHYAIPAFLERLGMLSRLYTDACAETLFTRAARVTIPGWLQPRGLRGLLGRRIRDVPAAKIRSFPLFALHRLLARQRAHSVADMYAEWLRANAAFGRLVIGSGFGDADTVYVFNGAGLEILQAARARGLRTIVEQTDAPVTVEESLLAEERQRWPEWEIGAVEPPDWKPMADREQAEWELADVILCGSPYVRDGLDHVAGPVARCQVVPYGFAMGIAPDENRHHVQGRPLRVLFAGTLCLRKGLPYVWEAARQLGGTIDFRAVGPSRVTPAAIQRLSKTVNVPGAVPRSDMQAQYAWADVLLLPSISEGSANVCYEALAHGLPIVTTYNSGSVVRDGVEGFIVPIRDSRAIVSALVRLDAERGLLAEMSQAARRRAAEFTWEEYSKRLLAAIAAPAPVAG